MSPAPAERLPRRTKLTWALGSLGDNYAGNAINQLKDAVYTVALGVPPEWLGWALALPRLIDAFLDPLVGIWSDRCGSRWGRRRPFIFCGAIALGLAMAAIWFPPRQWHSSPGALVGFFFATSMAFYAAYSIFLVPYRALGLELTRDYHERTRLQAWGMIVGLIGGLGLPWLYKLSLLLGSAAGATSPATIIIQGAPWVGAAVGGLILVTGIVPAIAGRERVQVTPSPHLEWRTALAATLRNRPFLQMLGMNGCAIIALFAPVATSLLVNIHYLYPGDQAAAATLTGSLGMVQMLGSLAGVPVNTALSIQLGKRGVALVAIGIALAGYTTLWIALRPEHPLWALPSHFLIGWGLQGIWLMSATMNADVCDSDELVTGARREGIYGAVFGLEQKLAYSIAALVGGYLVNHCGYVAGQEPAAATIHDLRVTMIACPVIALVAAAACITPYPLSRGRIEEIQHALARRDISSPADTRSSYRPDP